MAAVFGADRPADRPCLIGSSKANVGHLEAGAGIVGLIKATMAIKTGHVGQRRPKRTGVPPSTASRSSAARLSSVALVPVAWPLGSRASIRVGVMTTNPPSSPAADAEKDWNGPVRPSNLLFHRG
ncbi:hypothetical protein HGB38_30905 [Nocardia gamkensis]|uniref:Beta-ketoacyl synthase C-terminal domain-containing protein n=2 Tax=Nocardia gamkensis TaxID=352869 RepID=A0A7X6L9X8_9NOCA|nr:hypothetical protein [Nocardia gamkensis]